MHRVPLIAVMDAVTTRLSRIRSSVQPSVNDRTKTRIIHVLLLRLLPSSCSSSSSSSSSSSKQRSIHRLTLPLIARCPPNLSQEIRRSVSLPRLPSLPAWPALPPYLDCPPPLSRSVPRMCTQILQPQKQFSHSGDISRRVSIACGEERSRNRKKTRMTSGREEEKKGRGEEDRGRSDGRGTRRVVERGREGGGG